MPDSKITALASIGTGTDPAVDPLVIVDVSDTTMAASGTTKKVTLNNLLACSPTATLASATITGDLTVRTNQLIVNSSGVGVGATPSAWSGIGPALQVEQASLLSESSNQLYLTANGYFAGGQWNYINNASADQYYQVSGSHVWRSGTGGSPGTAIGWSTLMTLNSTGLGVGGSPTRKLSIVGSGATYANINSGDNTSLVGILLGGTSTPSAGQLIYDNTANSLAFFTSGASRLLIDTSGNVGVGVTPSAWGSNSKALQLGGGSASVSSTGAGSTASRFAHCAYFDNTNWLYQYTGVGPALYQVTGANAGSTHAWYIAPGGTAGNAITFTQAMTLDASGNLLVGTTSTAGSVSNTTKTVGGVFSSINGTTASTASGSAVTLFAAPTESSYLLSAYLFGAGSASAYHVVAIVKVNGGNVAITAISSATGISISSSGLNIQATQTSGISQAVSWNVVRLS